MTLDELKAMIEAEALRRQAARDGFTMEAVRGWLGQEGGLPPGAMPPIPPEPQPLTFHYLAHLDGAQFVTACYKSLLGRNPDPGGMEHNLAALLRGEAKAFLAGRIAYSDEGRKRGVPVVGLRLRYLVASARKLPVAGTILSWLVAFATLHRQQRQHLAFEQHVHARLDALAEHAARSSDKVAMRIDALRAVLEARD